MNLTRVLNNALPDIPARTLSERYPRVDPGATFREHIEDGEPIVRIYNPSTAWMYKLPRESWRLAQLFDGNRSYQEIAELYRDETGVLFEESQIREFAANLEAGDFWYKTPQEKNILLLLQTSEERRKKLQGRTKFADLSMITFPAFNPDRFLTWLYPWTSFFYWPWFIVLTLIAFAFMTGIMVVHWAEIGRDTVQFYNFSEKTWGDVAILYLLGFFVVAVHELGHAHACKHYGARVPAMGFALIFLTPAFYTDTTEGVVKGSRYQRLVISLAGIWSELMICAMATPIWWGTPPDTLLHDGAYFLMMLTGIASVLINWNPLMKLDGYNMLCEILGIADLKEDSTVYASAWVKRNIWRLPIEVPYVPKQRRLGFAVYALLSGAYSYMVLYIVAHFAGNVFRNFNPDWSFIPEITVALLIFRSRIRLLVNFMKFVYLDKKDRIRAWFTPRHTAGALTVAGILMLLPLWHKSANGRFVLEAVNHAVVRAPIPGIVTEIDARESDLIAAGATIAKLRNLPLQSKLAETEARYNVASSHARSAALQYTALGPALKEREGASAELRQSAAEATHLEITSPVSGVVLTPRLQDLLGTYLRSGDVVAEIADPSLLKARIYVSEYDVAKAKVGAGARLQAEGILKKWESEVVAITPVSHDQNTAFVDPGKLKGLSPPRFYLVDLVVANPDGRLKPGMTGTARVYGERTSMAGFLWRAVRDFWMRKVW
jgi:putative peptide zinc metalloprotease protein